MRPSQSGTKLARLARSRSAATVAAARISIGTRRSGRTAVVVTEILADARIAATRTCSRARLVVARGRTASTKRVVRNASDHRASAALRGIVAGYGARSVSGVLVVPLRLSQPAREQRPLAI